VQWRIAIDPFTHAPVDGALFNDAPVWNGQVNLELELQIPSEAEMGLLMLVLRDLILEDLPIGGTSNIGRGRFKLSADQKMQLIYKGESHKIGFQENTENTVLLLNQWVTTLNTELNGGQA
jgi:CRISPR/Cas system CSM-associated protein Csm3 (group 7 of RAMP superfamily)